MKTKITNAFIVKDFDEDIIFGDVVVEDDKIVYVGKMCDIEADKVIDANKCLLMPGFVNCNTKASSILFKGLITEKKIDDKIYQTKKYEQLLTGSDAYFGTMLSCLEYAKNGITTVYENYIFPDQSAKAFADCGIRAVVGVSQRYNAEKFLDEKQTEKLAKKIEDSNKNISTSFYCSTVTNADENMFDFCQKLAKNKTFVSCSASETLEEVGRCASLNNDLSPIELLEDYGFFDHDVIVMHATNVSQKDIQILSKNNVNVCATVGNDYANSNGVAPIYQMMSNGINICLGSDYVAVNGRQDMFREMYLALSSQNILLGGRELSAKDILKMATINGARALKLDNVGQIKKGYFADMILIDLNDISCSTGKNIFENLIMSTTSQDVLMTMVNGKIIYQNGKFNFKKSKKSIILKIKSLNQKFLDKSFHL